MSAIVHRLLKVCCFQILLHVKQDWNGEFLVKAQQGGTKHKHAKPKTAWEKNIRLISQRWTGTWVAWQPQQGTAALTPDCDRCHSSTLTCNGWWPLRGWWRIDQQRPAPPGLTLSGDRTDCYVSAALGANEGSSRHKTHDTHWWASDGKTSDGKEAVLCCFEVTSFLCHYHPPPVNNWPWFALLSLIRLPCSVLSDKFNFSSWFTFYHFSSFVLLSAW